MGDFETPPDVLAFAGLEAPPAQVPVEVSDTPPGGTAAEAARRFFEQQAAAAADKAEDDAAFVAAIARLVLGDDVTVGDRLIGASPGGPSTLRLAAELYRRARPAGWVWIGMPASPDHAAIFAAAGVPAAVFPLFDVGAGEVRLEATLAALAYASPGDAILLPDCWHEPSGARLTGEQWRALIELIGRRGLLPIVDLARHGLGEGLEADAAGARAIFAELPEAMLAYRCDQTFGLPGDSAGALLVQAATADQASTVSDTLFAIGRTGWPLRPSPDTAIVCAILHDPALTQQWQAELAAARRRSSGDAPSGRGATSTILARSAP